MPFYAIVEAVTGDLLDVVVDLDGELPEGGIAIELPAREDDIRAWLARFRKDRGGGGNGELLTEREDESAGGRSARPDEAGDAQAFFGRLQQELLRAEVEQRALSVLLFELAPQDRSLPREFIVETLRRSGHVVGADDFIAQIRDEVAGAILPGIEAQRLEIAPLRGNVTALTYPADADVIEQLQRRRHPLLRRSQRRAG
ncbi:MAG TPA: hypothetical protein VIH21_09355 [Dehalococcoidia bacterium]|jgi:hypothetical protein